MSARGPELATGVRRGGISCVWTSTEGPYYPYSVASVRALADDWIALGSGPGAPDAPPVVASLQLALRACRGEWILLLSPYVVFDDPTVEQLQRWLRSDRVHPRVRSLSWPRWQFSGDLQTIVQPGAASTLTTSAVRNVAGLTWSEDGFTIGDRKVTIDHPEHYATVIAGNLGVHDYEHVQKTVLGVPTQPFAAGHPEVFWRQPEAGHKDMVDPSQRGTDPAHLARSVVLPAARPLASKIESH